MKVTELRIGNLIQTKHKSHVIVNGIFNERMLECGNINNDYDDFNPDIEDMNPIPLTEEWLTEDKFDLEWIGGKSYEIGGFCFTVIDKGVECSLVGVIIEHVHTFQNFVHALTGNELIQK